MSPATAPAGGTASGASMASPFTPIAEYGFLSDCHTGALVAPDGIAAEGKSLEEVTKPLTSVTPDKPADQPAGAA